MGDKNSCNVSLLKRTRPNTIANKMILIAPKGILFLIQLQFQQQSTVASERVREQQYVTSSITLCIIMQFMTTRQQSTWCDDVKQHVTTGSMRVNRSRLRPLRSIWDPNECSRVDENNLTNSISIISWCQLFCREWTCGLQWIFMWWIAVNGLVVDCSEWSCGALQ